MTKYKVVERFRSIQGEGYWAGTQMDFVRLAQCPVGGAKGICKLWDGKEFVCDTGPSYAKRGDTEWHPYTQVNEVLSAVDIWNAAETEHLCLTGGEPLIYDISDILRIAEERTRVKRRLSLVHVETSGTVDIDDHPSLWVTLSPKQGCLPSMIDLANELKLLVHAGTQEKDVIEWAKHFDFGYNNGFMYLQPIEEDNGLWELNTRRALQLLKLNSNLRLSVQLHKVIHVR